MRYVTTLIIALLFAIGAMTASDAQAAVSVRINVNLGDQPVWGPIGYDYVENYYLPDIDVYYCVPQHRFYYDDGGRWIYSRTLPPRFHDYDLYHSYKVVVNDHRPWRHPQTYRGKYVSYKGRHDQEVIRDSHDSKYFVIKDHPEHGQWVAQQKQQKLGKHDNGHGQGRGK